MQEESSNDSVYFEPVDQLIGIDNRYFAHLAFIDGDNDGDFDVVVGEDNGTISYYQCDMPPVQTTQIKDTVIKVNCPFSWQLSGEIFENTDINPVDSLIFDAYEVELDALPDWLLFEESEGRTFTGIPYSLDTLNIVVNVSDLGGQEVNDTFKLTIVNSAPIPV